MHNVTIVQKTVPHYRVAFFHQLRERLRADGVRLRLLVAQPDSTEATKRDTVELPWGEPFSRRQYMLIPRRPPIEWHGVMTKVMREDLVIVEDAVRIVSNSALLAMRAGRSSPLVALWGHGEDRQGGDGPTKRAVRSRHHRSADWYFAYTPSVVSRLVAHGMPLSRITCVMNTIDTETLHRDIASVTASDVSGFLRSIGVDGSTSVALFSGGLYEYKRLEFLLEAGQVIADRLPAFKLLIAGAGPLQGVVEGWCRDQRGSWLHYLGPRFGKDLALLLKASQLLLMPGLVGLVIVDTFVAGCPIVTTADGAHSPEIDYLVGGVNGVILPPGTTPADYGRVVSRLITDDAALGRLKAGALASAPQVALSQMVSRFTTGVLSALERA